MLGTKRTKGRVWWHSLDPKELKYMGYLSPEKCKWTFEVTYYPNQSIHWPGSDWKYDPGIHWMASCCCCCFCIASVVSDSVRPHRRQPTRLPHPWDSPGKNPGVGCHFLLQCMKVKSESEVSQSCPTLLDPMDCSLPGSSVHGIFQAWVLEWGAIAFSNSFEVAFKKMDVSF